MKNTLYVSYDGLSDPLGQSQIVPYLEYISKLKHNMYLITFEKKNSFINYEKKIQIFIKENKINWSKIFFPKKNNRLRRFFDLVKLFFLSFYVIKINKVEIIHIRGFLPAIPILILSYFLNIKFIYDSRGLWVDERIDNGSLNNKKFIDKLIYKVLKKIENKIFLRSNAIIVLTRKAKRILKKNNLLTEPIIIPCCADYKHFNAVNNQLVINNFKKKFKIPFNKKIILYSGSTRGVYLFRDMLKFFNCFNKYNDKFIFLVVTNDYDYSNKIIKSFKNPNVYLMQGLRHEMPLFYSISDFMLCFIKPSYARQCSSPTKIAEAFASNLPIISNKGVGDIDLIVRKFNLGFLVDLDNKNATKSAAKNLINIMSEFSNIRDKSKKYFDLEVAISKYKQVYSRFEI